MYPLAALLAQNPLVAFVRNGCPWCQRLKALFQERGLQPLYISIDRLGPAEIADLKTASGSSTWPQVWFHKNFIGGFTESQGYAWP